MEEDMAVLYPSGNGEKGIGLNPMVKKQLFTKDQQAQIDTLKQSIIDKIKSITSTQKTDYEISITREEQLKTVIEGYKQLKEIYQKYLDRDYEGELQRATAEITQANKDKGTAIEAAVTQANKDKDTAIEAAVTQAEKDKDTAIKAAVTQANKDKDEEIATAVSKAKQTADDAIEDAKKTGSTEAIEMALAALINFGEGIQEKLNELDRENIEALEKAKKAAETESNAFSLFGWMKSKEVKEAEKDERGRKLFIKDLQELIEKAEDEETKHKYQAELARNTLEKSKEDTQYIESMMRELNEFKKTADSKSADSSQKQAQSKKGEMSFFDRPTVPRNARTRQTVKKSDLAKPLKKIEGGRGKGRKTKRSMSMGGNTKKRSKGGKRRTSKK